ncbi:MAG: hypothetical protein ACRD2W_11365 [Acidimicrobiales bacterium]
MGRVAWLGATGRLAASCPSTTFWIPPERQGRASIAMNTYGHRAMAYWSRHRPQALAQLTEPGTFFEELGEQIAAEVEDLEEHLAGAAPPGESYPDRVGRLNMARTMAEERVLADLVYSTWEDQESEPPTDETGAYVGGPPGWEPLWPAEPPDEEE